MRLLLERLVPPLDVVGDYIMFPWRPFSCTPEGQQETVEQEFGTNMLEAADWSVDQFGADVSPSRASEIIRQSRENGGLSSGLWNRNHSPEEVNLTEKLVVVHLLALANWFSRFV